MQVVQLSAFEQIAPLVSVVFSKNLTHTALVCMCICVFLYLQIFLIIFHIILIKKKNQE